MTTAPYTAPDPSTLTRATLARMIDHTLLAPTATLDEVRALVGEGSRLGVLAVCVSPSMLPLDTGDLVLATVCGFPDGKHLSRVKAFEAELAADLGAREVDMVIDVGAAKDGAWDYVQGDIAAVRSAIPSSVLLKVIIESAALTDEEIVRACDVSEQAGADYVKTSTGFHPTGGASAHAVKLMSDTVGGRLGVKASGGIRTTAEALEMIAAGATRLGLSRSAAILDGLPA